MYTSFYGFYLSEPDNQADQDYAKDTEGGLLTPLSSTGPAPASLETMVCPIMVAQVQAPEIVPARMNEEGNQVFQLAV
jgi:hypothetical protein